MLVVLLLKAALGVPPATWMPSCSTLYTPALVTTVITCQELPSKAELALPAAWLSAAPPEPVTVYCAPLVPARARLMELVEGPVANSYTFSPVPGVTAGALTTARMVHPAVVAGHVMELPRSR